MRSFIVIATTLAAGLLAGCLGNKGSSFAGGAPPPPVVNTLAVVVDTGPTAAPGAINHPYVTVKVCAPGSTQCATIDHVLLDTGSWGLRLVRSVLATGKVTLSPETDSKSQVIEECVKFGGGDTWGPVALADVTLAGEFAAKVPVQIMDDTNAGAPPPSTCGANNPPLNDVAGFHANGLLGVGVFAQDCGPACVSPATPLPMYYGCTSAGACTAENVALASQVTNPVALFAADNNGVIVSMSNLVSANGDTSVQGELIFGLATQADNALPLSGLTVLGADPSGDFTATYKGVSLAALIDSGTPDYAFNDPTIAVCSTGSFIGLYCPANYPLLLSAVNNGVGVNNNTNLVNFTVQNPSISFEPNLQAGAAAFEELAGGGGSPNFIWGMPFFYGKKIYIGIDQKVSGNFTGPYYAY